MQAHPILESRRQLGAYYTPNELSDILSNYLITSPSETLLEPSFGGGGILGSALARFEELGNPDSGRQLYGCDIDPVAFENLNKVVKNRYANQTTRFIKDDFLNLTKDSFYKNNFDLVIANPPYIGYGKMSKSQRVLGQRIQEQFSLKGGKASTWYFILLKSLQFLKEGGKIAYILPHAFIDSDYAESLRKFVGDKFQHACVYTFSKKIFADQGTNERVLVLVAEGWKPTGNLGHRLQAIQVDNFTDFEEKLYSYKQKGHFGKHYLGSKIGRVKGKLRNAQVNLINTYVESPYISKLGSFVNVKIGLVAGDAKFFTFNKEKAERYGLYEEKFLSPLMRSLRYHNKLTFGKSDFKKSENREDDCYLLNYSDALLNYKNYRSYLESYDLSTIFENQTFNKREIWCQVSDGNVPDFFIPCMSIDGPRLVLNTFKANCLNNTHRGFCVDSKTSLVQKKLIAVSMLTSFTQLVAELEAKQYGNETLKLEPSLYARLPLFIPDVIHCQDINDIFKGVNKLLDKGAFSEAVDMSSDYIYGKIFGPAEATALQRNFRAMLDTIKKYRLAQS